MANGKHKYDIAQKNQVMNLCDLKKWMKAWIERTDDFRTLRNVYIVMSTLDEMKEEL